MGISTSSIEWALTRLEQMESPEAEEDNPVLETIRQDPTAIMRLTGLTPDPWQSRLLTSSAARTLLLCTRQAGKSTVSAALALRTALLEPGALVLLLSPSQRQSGELFRKLWDTYVALGRPVPATKETILQLELANGSRVISLPGTETTIRGYSGASLLVIDEAARVPEALYRSVRPMLAVSRGRLVVLSTPFGKRGWFYEAHQNQAGWEVVEVTADQCPRISRAFLAEEETALGQRWFRQEYFVSFEDQIDSVFSHEDIMAAMDDDLEPLVVKVKANQS